MAIHYLMLRIPLADEHVEVSFLQILCGILIVIICRNL
jgi:hypothetical protein